MRVLDAACGIGLPGHQLRLGGYKGIIIGTDISPGMVARTLARGAHNSAFVADANEGLTLESGTFDLVVCTGAMELLQHAVVLREFARLLKPAGELWASFQHEEASPHALSSVVSRHLTAHQNVFGVTTAELHAELLAAGLKLIEEERCDAAFYTPRDGSLLPVPYLMVRASIS